MSQWDEIQFWASFGHERKKVELGSVSGTGGHWHLTINNFYQAQILTADGQVCCHFQNPEWWVTKADLDIICELVQDFLSQNGGSQYKKAYPKPEKPPEVRNEPLILQFQGTGQFAGYLFPPPGGWAELEKGGKIGVCIQLVKLPE